MSDADERLANEMEYILREKAECATRRGSSGKNMMIE